MRSLLEYNKKRLLVSVVLLFLAIALLLPLMSHSLNEVVEKDITPDRSFGYDLDDLEGMKELYRQDGARIYFITRITYDLIWPAVYLFFLLNILAFLLNGLKGKGLKALLLLPLVAVCFDLFENGFCSLYFFDGSPLIGLLAVISSRMKWYVLIFTVITGMLLGIYKIYRRKKVHGRITGGGRGIH